VVQSANSLVIVRLDGKVINNGNLKYTNLIRAIYLHIIFINTLMIHRPYKVEITPHSKRVIGFPTLKNYLLKWKKKGERSQPRI
jgi:hypothetical protein